MKTRKLGTNSPEVLAVGLGCMGNLKAINEAAEKIPLEGARLPEAALKMAWR
jgi:aryl-alcohol dehydrogenase-like predicted oxidoreductase